MTQTIIAPAQTGTAPVNSLIASRQWATRPEDERFTSLEDMLAAMVGWREESREVVRDTRTLKIGYSIDADSDPANPTGDVFFQTKTGQPMEFTHHSFNQLSQLVGAPAGYLRTLPPPVIAENLSYGLEFGRAVKNAESEAKLLYVAPEGSTPGTMRAFTGPGYGRIWNEQIVRKLIQFNQGAGGRWQVPLKAYNGNMSKQATTLYASPRDMFTFLVDETNPIDDGSGNGPVYKGFIVVNSEVGERMFWLMSFVYNWVCQNRIIWGMSQVEKIGFRHTSGAPARFESEALPAIKSYASLEAGGIEAGLRAAQTQVVGQKATEVVEYLRKRGLTQTAARTSVALVEKEGRAIGAVSQDPTLLYNVAQGVTAYARNIPYQNERTEIEEAAGKLLDQVFA